MSARRSPAARQASVTRTVVEETLLSLARIPNVGEVEEVRGDFERCLAALGALAQSDVQDVGHLGLLDEAVEHTRTLSSRVSEVDLSEAHDIAQRCAGAADALEAKRDRTIDAIVAVQDRAARKAGTTDASHESAASLGEPQRIVQLRPRVQTHVRMASEPPPPGEDTLATMGPRPEDIRRLQVLGGASLLADIDVAAHGEDGDLAFARRAAHDCLEEMGAIAMLHKRGNHDTWDEAGQEALEQRVLNNLDALVSLGEPFMTSRRDAGVFERDFDVLGEVLRYSRQGIAADERRAFGRAFVLGCVDGADTARAALLALRQSHPLTWASQADALALASGNAIDTALTEVCREATDNELVPVALEVLERRHHCPTGVVTLLLEHADGAVRRLAAHCLAHAKERDAALESLKRAAPGEPQTAVIAAIAQSLFIHDEAAGLALAASCIADEWAEPATFRLPSLHALFMVVASGGAAEHAELLQAGYRGGALHSAALGFHGYAAHVPALLSTLDPASDIVTDMRGRLMAARALVRITGAPLIREADPVNRDPYEPVTDIAPWRAYWEAHADDFAPKTRYRFGAPHTPAAVVAELNRPRMPFYARCQLAREHNRSTDGAQLDPRRFVATQRRILAGATR